MTLARALGIIIAGTLWLTGTASATPDGIAAAGAAGEVFLLNPEADHAASPRQERGLSVESVSRGPWTFTLPIDGRLTTIRLAPFSVRAAGFRLLGADATGSLHEIPVPEPATYRGTLDELPGARVGGSLDQGKLTATIALADGRVFCVEPVSGEMLRPGARPHRVYRADLTVGEGACPVEDAAKPVPPGPEPGNQTTALKFADIAVDADFEYLGANGGSATSTVNDIEALLNSVNVVFERDCDLRHRLVTLIVRSVEPDPYSSTDAVTLYNQMRTHWNTTQSGIERDVVHLMTGKELVGSTIGYAAVGEVCNRSRAYGLTQTLFTTNLARRTALMAHELGHNWNAVHCDGVSPCNIMCSSLGSCDFIGLPNFEPMGANAIRAFAATRSCLASVPVAVEDKLVPGGVQFAVPDPNPFSVGTRLEFRVQEPGFVSLDIFDVAGHRIASIVHGHETSGFHSRYWDGRDERGWWLGPGVFYARLVTPESTKVRKLTLLR